MNSTLPPEKINQIKQIIHDRYNEVDIQSQIRSIISEQMSNSNPGNNNHEAIVQQIKNKGIIDSLMTGIKFENHIHQATTNKIQSSNTKTKPANSDFAIPLDPSNIDPHKRQLYVQLLNGKAFLEYMNANTDLQDEDLPGASKSAYFTVFIHFRNQRFKTAPFRCCCEPHIQQGFLLDLSKTNNDRGRLLLDSTLFKRKIQILL